MEKELTKKKHGKRALMEKLVPEDTSGEYER